MRHSPSDVHGACLARATGDLRSSSGLLHDGPGLRSVRRFCGSAAASATALPCMTHPCRVRCKRTLRAAHAAAQQVCVAQPAQLHHPLQQQRGALPAARGRAVVPGVSPGQHPQEPAHPPAGESAWQGEACSSPRPRSRPRLPLWPCPSGRGPRDARATLHVGWRQSPLKG
jgi:hypothetical protein